MNARGVIHILLVGLVIIGLVIGLIVAIIAGLDRMHQERASESLFSEDAKITPILEDLREKKEELVSRVSEMQEQKAEKEAEPKTSQVRRDGKVEDRLEDLEGRLVEPSR